MLLQMLSGVNVAEAVVEACQTKSDAGSKAEEGATMRVNKRFIKQGEQHQSLRERKNIAFSQCMRDTHTSALICTSCPFA